MQMIEQIDLNHTMLVPKSFSGLIGSEIWK